MDENKNNDFQASVQCQCCGNVSYIHINFKREDDIYVLSWCSKCKKPTMHLDCGRDLAGYYELYNPNLDNRIY